MESPESVLIVIQADRVQGNLIFPYPAPVWPGLVGSQLDTDTGNYLTYDFGWRAGIDSFIEVIKFHLIGCWKLTIP